MKPLKMVRYDFPVTSVQKDLSKCWKWTLTSKDALVCVKLHKFPSTSLLCSVSDFAEMYGGPGSGGVYQLIVFKRWNVHLQMPGGGQPDYPAALGSLQHMDSEQLKVTSGKIEI